MAKKFSLEPLTMIGCHPAEMVRIAARTGYDFVSLRVIPMSVPGEYSFFPHDRDLVRATKVALSETGIGVHDIELARIVRNIEPSTYLPAMELGAELGARHLICSAWTDVRNDRDFIIERYAEICDMARPFDLTVSLEFPSFSRLTDLAEAADIVRAADRTNCGVLIDTLYIHLSRISLEEIASIPQAWLHFIHICDAPAEIPGTRDELIRIARDERLYPGEGCIDFAAIDAVLPEVIYAIELPNQNRLVQYGYEGHARRCLEAARRVLEPQPVPEKNSQRAADSASAR
jgi:sugar phosphate isomerase/epimerase